MSQHQDETEHDAEARRLAAVEQARTTIELLREVWGWLAELLEPGRPQPIPPAAMSDEQAERLEAIGHSDRTYRELNLAQGMSALPPSPAPVALSAVDAQQAVWLRIDTAVRAAERALDAAYVGGRPNMADAVEAALGWLYGTVSLLPRDPILRIDGTLAAANRAARGAAGVDEKRPEAVRDRCPACGRKSLQRDRDTGVIECISESCVCSGPDEPPCGCLTRAEDRTGRRHAWHPIDQDGSAGLWQAIAVADGRRARATRLRRGATGHGGWQSRGMANQQ